MASNTPEMTLIALAPEEGEVLWAFGFLATLKASSETTDGRVAVIEHLGPRGPGSLSTSTIARTSGSTSSRVS